MFKKRLLAYIIDVFIVWVIVSFASFLIPSSSNIDNLSNELVRISDNYIGGSVDVYTFFNQYSSIVYDIDKELFLTSLISVIISILYFVVYPLYNGGASIGKKLNGLKIIDINGDGVSANSLIFRYLLIDGIGVSILSMCFVFILNDFNYVVFLSILNFLQFLVVIISVFMVLYRRDFRSLPDLVAGTKVIEVKK